MTPVLHDSTTPTIALQLTPDFEVTEGRAAIAVTPGSERLIAFLACHPNRVRRTYVCGSLWFDADERHAHASLRSALWRVHSLDLVRSSGDHLWLSPAVEVDLRTVQADAARVMDATLPACELQQVADRLISTGDDMLSGWYEDWVLTERERFRQVRLQALDCVGERLLAKGYIVDALRVGLAATAADPLRESAHRLLTRVHLANGNVAEAVRQYRAFAATLHDELGVTPSTMFTDLVGPLLAPRSDAALAGHARRR